MQLFLIVWGCMVAACVALYLGASAFVWAWGLFDWAFRRGPKKKPPQ